MKSCAFAALAASIISSSEASALPVLDVAGDRSGEQERLLEHDAELLP